MPNIKDVCCKLARVSTGVLPPGWMSSKLEPVIWLRDTGHIGIYGGVDGRTVVRSYGDQNQIFSHRWVTIFS